MKRSILISVLLIVLCITFICSGCGKRGEWIWKTENDPSDGRTTEPGESTMYADDDAYTWWTNMLAVRYVDKKDQTYISYADEFGGLVVSAYNHKTGETTSSVIAKYKLVDDHNAPGLQILPNGKILAVYTRHNADK